jgi:KDO2-lipid IV(A) lauroyltransferase
MRRILEVLHDGGVLGVVLDQNRTHKEGVFVDFFGHPACTSVAVAVLAERLGATVVPLCFYRTVDHLHHVAEFLPEISWEAPFPRRQDNIRHNTQRYTAFIEHAIRQHPEQWIWMHRRWRTRPRAPAVSQTAAAPVSS